MGTHTAGWGSGGDRTWRGSHLAGIALGGVGLGRARTGGWVDERGTHLGGWGGLLASCLSPLASRLLPLTSCLAVGRPGGN